MAEQNEREKYVAKLHSDLAKVIAANDFHATEPGQLIIGILQADVTNATNDLLSNKFVDDHNGYLDARARAAYASTLLGRLTKLANVDQKPLRQSIDAAKKDADPGDDVEE